MKKIGLIISFLFIFTFNLLPENKKVELQTFFSDNEINRVLKQELISRMYVKYNYRQENTDLSITIPETTYTNEFLSYYEVIVDEKGFIPYELTDEKKLAFYNTLLGYTRLKGMNYYSRSDNEVKKLVIDCYRVDNPKKRKKIADPVAKEILPKTENYFFQQDNKFGKLVYKSELYNEGNNFIMVNTSQDNMGELFLEICKSGEYKIIVFFIYDEQKEGYFYYALNVMRIRNEGLLQNSLLKPTGFSNRLRAAMVYFANLLGQKWDSKLNPWDETKLKNGDYRTY